MRDPYAILGLDKSASEAEIVNAYRTLAGTMHPDRGGNVNAFAEISEAATLLRNPMTRAVYDETGQWGGPYNLEGAALGLIVSGLMQASEQAAAHNVDPGSVDLLAVMREGFNMEIANTEKALAAAVKTVERLRKIATRLSGQRSETLRTMLENLADDHARGIAGMHSKIKAIQRALEMSHDVAYAMHAELRLWGNTSTVFIGQPT